MKKKKWLMVVLAVFLVSFVVFSPYTNQKTHSKLASKTDDVAQLTGFAIEPEIIDEEVTDIGVNDFKKQIALTDELIERIGTKEEIAEQLKGAKTSFFILQFIGPVQQQWKHTLEQEGVEFIEYLPYFSYKVKLVPEKIPQVLKFDFVHNIIDYKPEYKIPKETKEVIELKSSEEIIPLEVSFFDDLTEEQIESLKQISTSFFQRSQNVARVAIKKKDINLLKAMDNVDTIEESKPLSILNNVGRAVMETEYLFGTYNLTGFGQVIGSIDSGIDNGSDNLLVEDDIHLDFDNRITSISIVSDLLCQVYGASCTNPDDKRGHGTHVVGSIMGNGSRNLDYKGIANKAGLSFYAAGDDAGSTAIYIDNLNTMLEKAYNDSARIHSDSWGADSNTYDSYYCKNMDKFMSKNNDMLIIVSAGNNGPALNTVGYPGTAKNPLTVGALQSNRSNGNINLIASYSSRGPANDGRIKPDVVAPGSVIISTLSSVSPPNHCGIGTVDNYYTKCSGTSMATPLVAGFAALVREHFIKNLNVSNPGASLLKAAIINGAVDVGYGIPSNHTGWGRVNLTNIIGPDNPRETFFVDKTAGLQSTGDYNLYTFTVDNDTAQRLKITLAWTDKESGASALTNLVNDLDMVITSPNGTIYYGNDFYEPYNSEQDRLNNVEQIRLDAGSNGINAGNYTLNISAYSLAYLQTYSFFLAIDYLNSSDDESNISEKNPSAPANLSIQLNADGSIALSWDLAENAETYNIYYSDNVTELIVLSIEYENTSSNISGLTGTEYTDNNIFSSQRYYRISAANGSKENISNTVLALFKIEIAAATGNPSIGNELNLISLPINATNDLSLNSLMPSASEYDVVYAYDSVNNKTLSSQYFDGRGWFGDIAELEVNKGYVFKPVSSSYNITLVGFVPVGNSSIDLKYSAGVAGNGTEINLIGFNTPRQLCGLDSIFYKAASGDTIFYYDAALQLYTSASHDGNNWSGDFDCIEPGHAYELRNVAFPYTLNYER